MMKHFVKGKIINKEYDLFAIIRIMNPRQAAFYLANGVELQDIEISEDRKNGDPVLCYFFNREDTKDVFDLWCKRKENNEV